MKSSREQILSILENLMKMEDIYACMFVSRGMAGIVPNHRLFKKEVIPIWEMLSMTMDEMFSLIEEYEKYGLREIFFDLLEYQVMFFVVPNTNTALVAISPALSNKGLVLMELNKTRKDIINLLK